MSPIIVKGPPKRGKYDMRWDCERDGCYLKKCVPKWGVFADCFPVGTFSDIDGAYERNGQLLLVEWKHPKIDIQTSQLLLHQRGGTLSKITTFVVWGDAETMEVESVMPIWQGKTHPEREMNQEGLKAIIKKWVAWANRQTWKHGWL